MHPSEDFEQWMVEPPATVGRYIVEFATLEGGKGGVDHGVLVVNESAHRYVVAKYRRTKAEALRAAISRFRLHPEGVSRET